MNNPFKRAFTLIEMLVVVAIIMVLSGMLLPVLGKARESGRNARCASNLRQLQLAALSYAGDNSCLPQSTSSWSVNSDGTKSHQHGWVAWFDIFGSKDSQGTGGQYAWCGDNGYSSITNGSLWSFMSNSADPYLCPTFSLKSVCGQVLPKFSYAMNSQINGASLLGLKGATLILFGDEAALIGMASPTANLISQFTTNQVGAWHNKKGNVVYVDGHVEQQ